MKTLKTVIATAALFAAFNSNAQEAFYQTFPRLELAICPIDYRNEYLKAKADFDVYEYDNKFRGVFDYAFDFDGDSITRRDIDGCTVNALWGSSGTGGILTTNLQIRADFDMGATPKYAYMDFRMYLGIIGVADEDAPIVFHNREILQFISSEEYSACLIDLLDACSEYSIP